MTGPLRFGPGRVTDRQYKVRPGRQLVEVAAAGHLLAFIRQTRRRQPMRIHMDMGEAETDLFGADVFRRMEEVEAALLESGFGRAEIRYQVIPDGVHSELAWRARTEDILRWLHRMD